MNSVVTLSQSELSEFLLDVALVRPVFIWGQPGIGKSSLVSQFAAAVEMECALLDASQLAPEDLIGVPELKDGLSHFRPPATLVRDQAFVLFLDDFNKASAEVQKACYTLILEQRLGEYQLPKGSVVILAGNRTQDSAMVKPLSSAIINRVIHVHLRCDHRQWLKWASAADIHPLVYQYVAENPDHLTDAPPKLEEPFSTPRSWHMLSDGLKAKAGDPDLVRVEQLALGCLTPHHAKAFSGFVRLARSQHSLASLLKGDMGWPTAQDQQDILFYLARGLRGRLLKELPQDKPAASGDLAFRAKKLIADLAPINLEAAQLIVSATEDSEQVPTWFMTEVIRDVPRLAGRKERSKAS